MSDTSPKPTVPATTTTSPTTSTYPKTATLPPITILPPTPENISSVLNVVANAFHSTPFLLSILIETDSIPPAAPKSTITQSRRRSYYTAGITRLAESGATLVESGNFSAVAIWEPSTFAAPDFSSARTTWVPSSRKWTREVKRARARYLGVPGENPALEDIDEMTTLKLRPFWHLGFLARDPEREKVPGAISAVVLPFLQKAREEGVPAWLEATTMYGVRLYEFFGFRLVETVTIGRGVYGEDGWFEEGGKGASGKGASGFCMIYDGHLTGGEGR